MCSKITVFLWFSPCMGDSIYPSSRNLSWKHKLTPCTSIYGKMHLAILPVLQQLSDVYSCQLPFLHSKGNIRQKPTLSKVKFCHMTNHKYQIHSILHMHYLVNLFVRFIINHNSRHCFLNVTKDHVQMLIICLHHISHQHTYVLYT